MSKSEIVHDVENKGVQINNYSRKVAVSLWLDSYENIFSDFDPRSFASRALSDDFLRESKKVIREIKHGVMDLTLLIPYGLRDRAQEKVIKERLHSHFRKEMLRLEKEYKKGVKVGILLAFAGMVMMFMATVSSINDEGQIISHVLRVVFEPAGWFSTWYGLDKIFYTSQSDKRDLDFSEKMAHAEIDFDSYKV